MVVFFFSDHGVASFVVNDVQVLHRVFQRIERVLVEEVRDRAVAIDRVDDLVAQDLAATEIGPEHSAIILRHRCAVCAAQRETHAVADETQQAFAGRRCHFQFERWGSRAINPVRSLGLASNGKNAITEEMRERLNENRPMPSGGGQK